MSEEAKSPLFESAGDDLIIPTFESRILYFGYQRGCAACESAKSPLITFEVANLGRILIMRVNLSYTRAIGGWSPKATPAYLYAVNGQVVAKHTGALDVAHLQRFVDGKLQGEE